MKLELQKRIVDKLMGERSKVVIEVQPGIWKQVTGPAELIATLPYGGQITLGFNGPRISGTNTIGGGKCNVSGRAGRYTLNGFDISQATLEDIR